MSDIEYEKKRVDIEISKLKLAEMQEKLISREMLGEVVFNYLSILNTALMDYVFDVNNEIHEIYLLNNDEKIRKEKTKNILTSKITTILERVKNATKKRLE